MRHGVFTAAALFAGRGVIAGCSFATTLVKVYLLRKLDRFVQRLPPALELSCFIDDVGIHAENEDSSELVEHVADATTDLEETLAEAKCRIEPTKTQVAASCRAAARKLCRILGLKRDPQGGSAPALFLGADFAPGRGRQGWARLAKRRARLDKVTKRAVRLRRLRSAAGERAKLLAAAGLAPQGGYDTEITGLDDGELRTLRRAIARGYGPKAGGRSLSAALLVEGDSSEVSALAPVVRWAAECWDAGVGRRAGGLDLPQLRGCLGAGRRQPTRLFGRT